MRRRACWAIAIALGILAACSSFEAVEPPSTNVDLDASPPSDAGTASDVDRPPPGSLGCTPPRALDCDPVSGCALTSLYKPTEVEYAFSIVTDSDKIYWVTQTDASGNGPAFDGAAVAKIHWIPKRGVRERRTVTGGQPRTTALVLDGSAVYWAARAENNVSWALRRADRDCSNVNTGDNCGTTFHVALGDEPVVDLRSMVPGSLVATTSKGTVLLIDLASKDVRRFTATGDLPTLTTTESSAFAASQYRHAIAEVQRMETSLRSYGSVPDAGKESGIGLLTTDCTTLFGLRTPENTGEREVFAFGGATPQLVGTIPRTFAPKAFAADAKHLYVSGSGGILVARIADRLEFARRDGPDIWRIAVDDDGVYYANHNTGELYLLGR